MQEPIEEKEKTCLMKALKKLDEKWAEEDATDVFTFLVLLILVVLGIAVLWQEPEVQAVVDFLTRK